MVPRTEISLSNVSGAVQVFIRSINDRKYFILVFLLLVYSLSMSAAQSAEQVLALKRRHIFLGEMTSYMGSRGIKTDFAMLGFENLNRLQEPNQTLIFNRKKKLMYSGSDKNALELNRASILVGMSARANTRNFTWGNEKWSAPEEVTLKGLKCAYYVTNKNKEKWEIWVLKDVNYPAWLNRTISEWLRLPNLNGIAARALRTNRFGKVIAVMELLDAKRIPAPANYLETPKGFQQVSNVADVCTAQDELLQDVLDTLK